RDGITEVKDALGNVTTKAVPEVAFEWGLFVTACIDFILVAFVMFLVIKIMNRMKKKEAEVPVVTPEPSSTDILLMEIRDSLKK
ncbi:MAG: MscL family protein, partial [Chitinophagaceae bacterium]